MKGNKKYTVFLMSVIVLMIAAMIVTILSLHSYVNKSVHNERKTYLTAQTKSVAGFINKSLDQYLDYSSICKQTVEYELSAGAEITEFMDEIQDKLSIDDARLILVDSNCTWYGENSSSGRITATGNYTRSTPDSLVYITTGVDTDVESFVFRTRLDNPIDVKYKGNDVTINYCSVIYYMDDFKDYINIAFPYECNSFICDEYGLMMYKDFSIGTLISGTNLLVKYENADFLFGDESSALINEIKMRTVSVAEMQIDKTNYFICTAPLSYNNWLASFVVDTDQISAGTYADTIYTYIITIGSIFAIALAVAGYALIRISTNKMLLEKEREANAYLEKASSAKSEFLSNMSHDIRTPINGILGMTALARKDVTDERTIDCLNKIEISSKYLQSLVNDILDMSAIESGALKIDNQVLNIRKLGLSCIDIIKGQTQDRKLNIISNFDKLEHVNILADERHLRQIFINILSNAVKFTPDGGTIEFRADEIGAEDKTVLILFEIRDTGIGMEPEFLNNIWERFSQAGAGARSKYKGTGLGMAITKRLVDAMGGQIEVRSKVNEGSSFIINLSFEISDTAAESEESEEAADITGARILLVEDNEINMEIASELLKENGAVITQAENGRIALDTFRDKPEFSFDLILMDIMMPEMDGIESCKAIRALDRSDARNIPIIAMTANALSEEIEDMKMAGMNAYLSKPINLPLVLRTIASFYKGGQSM